MKIKAEAKYIRTSPRKIRLVADLVRKLPLNEALTTLTHLRKRAAKPMFKVLKQAQSNAVNNHNLAKDSLLIQSIEVNEGATYKRWNPVSRGRAHSILKRTSHIKVILRSEAKKPKESQTLNKSSKGADKSERSEEKSDLSHVAAKSEDTQKELKKPKSVKTKTIIKNNKRLRNSKKSS